MNIDIKELKLETNIILARELEKLPIEAALPKAKNMYSNKYGIHWAGAIGIEIKNFKILYQNNSREDIIKMLQAFTSGIISIMKRSKMYRKSWVNESDVTGLFACKAKKEIAELMMIGKYINSFANYLLADALKSTSFRGNFRVGIGVWLSNTDSFISYGEEINEKDFHQTIVGESVKNALYLAKSSFKKYRSKILFNDLIKRYWDDADAKRFEKEKWIRTYNDIHTSQDIFGHSVRFNSFASSDQLDEE